MQILLNRECKGSIEYNETTSTKRFHQRQHGADPAGMGGFCATIEPPALTMDDTELRDHARQMLHAFATDLATPQSEHERAAKSMGLGMRGVDDTAAETRAEARLLSG
jgi:hypothetical protein